MVNLRRPIQTVMRCLQDVQLGNDNEYRFIIRNEIDYGSGELRYWPLFGSSAHHSIVIVFERAHVLQFPLEALDSFASKRELISFPLKAHVTRPTSAFKVTRSHLGINSA